MTVDALRVITYDRRSIHLVRLSDTPTPEGFHLIIDGIDRGVIALSPNYPPGLALSRDMVALWSGSHLYVASFDKSTMLYREHGDFIGTVFVVDAGILVVGDVSVSLLDRADLHELATIECAEIITRCWWSSDVLHIEDLQGQRRRFALVGAAGEGTTLGDVL